MYKEGLGVNGRFNGGGGDKGDNRLDGVPMAGSVICGAEVCGIRLCSDAVNSTSPIDSCICGSIASESRGNNGKTAPSSP